MLRNTFCHIPGIGPQSEQKLWRTGFTCWDALLAPADPPRYPGRKSCRELLRESVCQLPRAVWRVIVDDEEPMIAGRHALKLLEHGGDYALDVADLVEGRDGHPYAGAHGPEHTRGAAAGHADRDEQHHQKGSRTHRPGQNHIPEAAATGTRRSARQRASGPASPASGAEKRTECR